MSDFINQIQILLSHSRDAIALVLLGLAVIWGIHFFNVLLGYRLNNLGILPRSPRGLIGIILAPFLHGSFNHLFCNTIPLFVLGTFVLLSGLPTFFCVSSIVIVGSGLLVWLFGRNAVHVGASGLIMGYWGFLMANALYHETVVTVLLVAVSLYYFGGLIMALLPGESGVSWEAHVFGFFAGLAAVYLCGTMS